MLLIRIQGSSVSIVSDYGLEDRAIGVRSAARAEDFSSFLCVQTSSEAHPASCTMGIGGKARLGRDADHSPPSRGVGAIPPLPPSASMVCSGTALLYFTLFSCLVKNTRGNPHSVPIPVLMPYDLTHLYRSVIPVKTEKKE
jgi:hypothetical protein